MAMMAEKTGPDATSSDYDAMLPYWSQVETILEGAEAMRLAAETYLPKFPNETTDDYEYRRANARFTNIYADIVSNLASKPFAEEVTLAENAGSRFEDLQEDIDGQGNNLNVFASQTFFAGVNYAIDWIFVDYTRVRPRSDGRTLTLADQREQNLRPYWVHVPAKRMLAVYSDVVNGQQLFVHARISENITRREGFKETCVERVRVLDREPIFAMGPDGEVLDQIVGYAPATFQVWEKRTSGTDVRTKTQWEIADQGPVTIGVIPIAPFITGRRKEGSWRFVPPLQGVADLQVEHYQAETALKSIKELTAFPMLAGNGVQPATDASGNPTPVPVGPRSVLYAPPTSGETASHGEWKFIEPSAESLRFLAEQVASTEEAMRELGRQPLTATAGITVVTAALASQKASSAVQAWAFALKDALEQAWALTARYLNDSAEPEVTVFTDFALESGDEKGPEWLRDMAKRGRLSKPTEWAEAKRRGVLSGDFDPDEEEDLLLAEAPDEDDEQDLLDAAAARPANAA